MIKLDIRGIDSFKQLNALASTQIPYAMMVALNNTAFAVQRIERQRLPTVFDRPTPLVQSSVRVEKATKENLTAAVYIDPKRVVMGPHEHGGDRGLNRLERVLRGKGWLPSGYRAVPSRSMERDAYGNPARAEVNKLLKGLQAAAGYSWQRTRSQRYFCIPVGSAGRLSPGIWLEAKGSSGRGTGGYRVSKVMPMFLFVPSVRYARRLGFMETVKIEARRVLPDEMASAIQRAIDTAR